MPTPAKIQRLRPRQEPQTSFLDGYLPYLLGLASYVMNKDFDDDVKAVIEAGGSINQLKAVFRKQRGKYLQEHAAADHVIARKDRHVVFASGVPAGMDHAALRKALWKGTHVGKPAKQTSHPSRTHGEATP